VSEDDEESPRNGNVLHEIDRLHLVSEVPVKQECRQYAEPGQGQCKDARLPSQNYGQRAHDLNKDHQGSSTDETPFDAI
jgi:hypothetical protein